MPGAIPGPIMTTITEALLREEAALARAAERRADRVVAQYATGTANLDETFALNLAFRLVYLRVHFSGPPGTAVLTLSVDSARGNEYDAELDRVGNAGPASDVHYCGPATELARPSPWTFQPGDAVRVHWTNPNPGTTTWAIEAGLAPA